MGSFQEKPPTSVQLRVSSAPDGACVLIGRRVLGLTPGPIAIEYGTQPVKLTVDARGFLPRTFTRVPDADITLDAPLEKRAWRKAGKEPLPHDLEDPF